MAILTAETGLIEKFTFLKLTGDSQEALIINFTGLLLILFAISVGLSVLLPRKHWDTGGLKLKILSCVYVLVYLTTYTFIQLYVLV